MWTARVSESSNILLLLHFTSRNAQFLVFFVQAMESKSRNLGALYLLLSVHAIIKCTFMRKEQPENKGGLGHGSQCKRSQEQNQLVAGSH